MRKSRIERFIALAEHVGTWSKDRSTQVGCVIVGPSSEIRSVGYNGFPRDVEDEVDKRHERPDKYKWTEHAERNAIYNAARVGTPLEGCSIVIPWYPCADCSRAIIQSGIKEVICNEPIWEDQTWGRDFQISEQMFEEAGIEVVYAG